MTNTNCNDFTEVRQVLQAKWLRIHIRNRIYALKLSSSISEEDVIQYVVMCLVETLRSGTQVNHPVAWSKLVSERYIQKLYKKHRVSVAIESDKIEYLANRRCDEKDFYENNEEIVKKIQQLKPANREIVEMRFFQNLSWSQIAEILSHQEGKQIRVVTARKRGERALEELRKIYFNKLID
ncbi:MAG: sigma-70 family RNA polymerase sigma factor [Richelia sp. RM1_1_1]|nr:sigma-70 family RNA polymerase sigma factor [Richelia sp. RM1_1_1]